MLRHLTWKGLVSFVVLHPTRHLFIAEIHTLMNERLPDDVVSSVIEVLRGKSCLIDGQIARISLLNHMLFNEIFIAALFSAQHCMS